MTKSALKVGAVAVLGFAMAVGLASDRVALAQPTSCQPSAGSPPASSAPVNTPKALSQRVWALQTIYDLSLTPAQLKHLADLTAETVDKQDAAAPANVSRKYIAALESLQAALLRGDDDDRIDDARDEVDTIEENENVDIDDSVTITDAARIRAVECIRLLTPSQVAGYCAETDDADDVPAPVEMLMDAADEIHGANDKDAADTVEQTTEDLRILLGGLDVQKSEPVAAKIQEWLKHARSLSDADFKAQRADLEKSANELCSETDPFTVLRHSAERDMAELLSNPQLAIVVQAKLAQIKPGNK